jgi:hypothetical protein
VLPLRGSESQPTLFLVFINERQVSALQSYHGASHKHEWTTVHGLKGRGREGGLLLVPIRQLGL